MNKIVINHLEKTFMTSDAHTIVKEMDVQHPAAKVVAMAANRQNDDFGDATNLVFTLAGELLLQAENLIRIGIHPNFIVQGYQKALDKAIPLLEQSKCY